MLNGPGGRDGVGYPALAQRDGHGMRAVVGVQLLKHGCHVVLDRRLRYAKLTGDLLVAQSHGGQPEDLGLSGRKQGAGALGSGSV